MGTSVLQLYLKHHAMGDRAIIYYLIRVGASYSMLEEYYFYKIRSMILPALIEDRVGIAKLMVHRRWIQSNKQSRLGHLQNGLFREVIKYV